VNVPVHNVMHTRDQMTTEESEVGTDFLVVTRQRTSTTTTSTRKSRHKQTDFHHHHLSPLNRSKHRSAPASQSSEQL
jgi:hypothetical protein